jgi:hypothetical protein
VTGVGGMGKEGKKEKKKSKGSKEREYDETVPGAVVATRSVSVKVLKENTGTSGCALACFSGAPAPADLLDKGPDPYKFQCVQSGKNGVRSLSGHKVCSIDSCPECSFRGRAWSALSTPLSSVISEVPRVAGSFVSHAA